MKKKARKMAPRTKASMLSRDALPKRLLSSINAARKAFDKMEGFVMAYEAKSLGGRKGATAKAAIKPTGKRRGRKPKSETEAGQS